MDCFVRLVVSQQYNVPRARPLLQLLADQTRGGHVSRQTGVQGDYNDDGDGGDSNGAAARWTCRGWARRW